MYMHAVGKIMELGAGMVGTTLQAFTESAEVLDLLDKLPSVVSDMRTMESAEQRFTGAVVCLRVHTRVTMYGCVQ